MLTPSGPKVLEYNVRFGDPETEALMLLLHEDVDLVSVLLVSLVLGWPKFYLKPCQACSERHLDSVQIPFRNGFAVSVILASEGYPGTYSKGRHINFKPVPSSMFSALTITK